jgi:hypothetical protein
VRFRFWTPGAGVIKRHGAVVNISGDCADIGDTLSQRGKKHNGHLPTRECDLSPVGPCHTFELLRAWQNGARMSVPGNLRWWWDYFSTSIFGLALPQTV